jgi:hypothetical protein
MTNANKKHCVDEILKLRSGLPVPAHRSPISYHDRYFVDFPFLLQVDRSIGEEQLQGHDNLLHHHPHIFSVLNTLAISFRIICLQVLLGSSPLTYETQQNDKQ